MNERLESRSDKAKQQLLAQSEMRLSTVMMVDMVASTEISAHLGPEASFLLQRDVLQIARSLVAAHGGTMMDEVGDGFFALFGAPISIDRASLTACRAGLEICAAVHEAAGTFKAKFGFEPQLRVGLVAGEVLITGQKEDGTLKATGSAVNLAARIESLAEPNGVVCSSSVAIETEGWARFEPLPPRDVKGFAEPIETFRLLDVVSHDQEAPIGNARGAGGFVGRTEELDQLMRWNAQESGNRPFSLIVGEAGIGKSRILSELAERLGNSRLIIGSCHPTTTARPLAPLIDIFRGFAGWSPGQPTETFLAAIDPVLPSEQSDRKMLVKLIMDQAPSDAEQNPSDAIALQRTLSAALTSLGLLKGCLLAIEDLHWIDPLSAEVLMTVVRSAPDSFRMLGTTRPVDWLNRLPQDRVESVLAGPMQAADIRAIAQALMGEAANETLVEQVMENSEGNPFFATEVLHNVATTGDGVEAGRIGAIQNIALARFDRLEPATKALLRMASLQGRSFRLDVLRLAARERSEDIVSLLNTAEGIVESDPVDPEGSGRFHHILFRDSIYATIPPTTSKAMHLATAQALEVCADNVAGAGTADLLADHYDLAGEPVRAVKFLQAAAHNAYGLYALESCKSLMERAFRLIEVDIDEFEHGELEDAVSIWMRCLDVMDQFRSVIEVSNIWLPRLRTAEGSATQALLLALTSKAHCHMANFEQSHQLVNEALNLATRLGHERAIAYSKVVMMRTLSDSGLGNLEDVERLFDETRAYIEDLNDGTLYANRMFHMMAAYRTEGLMRRAREVNDEIQAFGERHKQTHVILVSNWNRALNAAEANDYRTALSYAEAGLEHSVRNTAVWEVFMMLKLAAQLGLGIDVPIEGIEKIHENAERRGELTTRNAAATQFGFTSFFKGRIWQGWRQFRKCEALMASTGHVEARRYFLLQRAELLLILGGYIQIDGPRPKLGPADIALAIYLRLTARRSAKALLNRLLFQLDRGGGIFVARAQACLAVIAAAEGKTEAALEGFALAERLFRAEGLTAELDRLAGLRTTAGL